MKKIKIPTSRKFNLALICFVSAFIGWESHVFKLWVVDILGKAKVCDETNCLEILQISKELNNYNIPVKKNNNKYKGG